MPCVHAGRAVLQLLSQVTHPWVNQYMQVVGHPDLNRWDGSSPPMIGDVVSAVISEFRRAASAGGSSGHDGGSPAWSAYPQQHPSSSATASQPYDRSSFDGREPPPGSGSSGGGRHSADGGSGQREQPTGRRLRSQRVDQHTPIPPIPQKFDELEGMTTPQLERLLDDDVARQAMLLAMPSVVGMKEIRSDVRRGNLQTAQATLAKEEQCHALRKEAEDMRGALKELQVSYEGTWMYPCKCHSLEQSEERRTTLTQVESRLIELPPRRHPAKFALQCTVRAQRCVRSLCMIQCHSPAHRGASAGRIRSQMKVSVSGKGI